MSKAKTPFRPHEIELLAHQVIARVQNGQPAEDDSLVELKAEWPIDAARAARRIAAHANSAQGERIVWLLGVDEGARLVPGVAAIEPSQWWDRVCSHFDQGWCPTMTLVTVPYEAVTVVALVFETGGAPFIIKHGDLLEVPWREATKTRSARRADLLRILVPLARRPDYELRRGSLLFREHDREYSPLWFRLELTLYVTPQDERAVVLPYHRMKAAVFSATGREIFEFDEFSGLNTGNHIGSSSHTGQIRVTDSEIIVHGPGNVVLTAEGSGDWVEVSEIEKVCEIRMLIRPAGDVPETKISHEFTRVQADPPNQAVWVAMFGFSWLPRPSGL